MLAPGIPLTHPEPHWSVRKAQEAGVEVIGDTELFFRERTRQGASAKVVVITGTNGKSTTTALTAHLLQVGGRPVALGGNIGRAVLDLPPFATGLTYVLELSTFQIDLTPSLAPDAAALINITPDHLDRHGTIENYAAIKARVFDHLPVNGTAVIGVDDDYSRAIADALHGPYAVKRIAVGHPVETGVWAKDGMLTEVENGVERGRVGLDGIGSLRGAHNWQNAARGLRACPLARARRLDHRQGAWNLCRPCPPHGAGGEGRVGPLRQRLEGHQCRCRRQGVGELHRHLLDCRRQAEGRRPRRPRAVLSQGSPAPI